MSTTTPERQAPRRPALDRPTAARLAATEYDRFTDLVATLEPQDWARPTACPAWDVHAVVCHVLGMAQFAASPVEQVRQLSAARRRPGLLIDGLTALQVDKHRHRPPEDLVRLLREVGPRAARARRRTPGPVRAVRMRDQPVDETGSQVETWTMGYLVDVVLTRDTWMHRSDVAAATGHAMVLTQEHDGVLVADVAHEWLARHGQPCVLNLTGPAGGRFEQAAAGSPYELDAVDFCRTVSGRGRGEGLLATRVPF